MISKLAEDIYTKSIRLKKYDAKKLLLKNNRVEILNELKEIQILVDSVLRLLHDDSSFSSEYYELAVFMQRSLFECVCFLASKNKNYRETVRRYICGYHNLSRAFLSAENPMRISPNEAMEYYKPYLKLD